MGGVQMREIKFRAWDKVRMKMFDNIFYSYHRKNGIYFLNTERGILNFSERKAFEVLFCHFLYHH